MNNILLSLRKWTVRILLGLGIISLSACSNSSKETSSPSADSTAKKLEAPTKKVKPTKVKKLDKKIEKKELKKVDSKIITKKHEDNTKQPPNTSKVYGPPRERKE